jgi:hypothetical protein
MEMLLKVGMLPRKYGYDATSLQQSLFVAGLQAIPIQTSASRIRKIVDFTKHGSP